MRAAAFVAAAVLLLSSCDRTPTMTAADARQVHRLALTEVGLPPTGVITTRSERCGDVAGWRTSSEVDGGDVALCIAARSDRIVSLADPDEVVSDAAFDRLEDFRWNPAAERRERTAGWAIAGSSLLAGAVVLLSLRFRKERGARGAGGPSQDPFDQDR